MGNSISTTSNTQAPTNNTTLANQALNGLDNGLSIVQNKHRKVIDLTSPNDDEVILMPSIMLSDIACDINAAASTLHDLGQLLHLIATRQIEPHAAIALARLSQDAADTWINLLYSQLEIINEPLAQTGFGKVDSYAY